MESSDERLVVHQQLIRRAARAWFGVAALFEPLLVPVLGGQRPDQPPDPGPHALYLDEPLTIGQVAQLLGRRPGVTGGIVNRLARLGLVRRRPSERDLRMVEVVLTGEGREIVRQMESGLPDFVAPLLDLDGMGRDAKRFVELLERFVRAGGIETPGSRPA